MKKYFPALQYINIPNLITTMGMAFGIAACYHMLNRDLQSALVCIFFAMVMDLIDGFVAAKLDRQTQFGKHIDTLVDFFICCIIPMLMTLIFIDGSAWFIGAVTFYCVCGLWRLANYNIVGSKDTRGFTGLPVPGAMTLVTLLLWAVIRYDLPSWFLAVMFVIAGALMLSLVRLVKYGFLQKMLWVVGLGFILFVVFFA